MLRLTHLPLCLSLLVISAVGREEERTESARGMAVPFHAWVTDGGKPPNGVLVLVPDFNGQGEAMLDARWRQFAEKNALVLLVPTFHAEGDERNQGRGYYYPEQGSGKVME